MKFGILLSGFLKMKENKNPVGVRLFIKMNIVFFVAVNPSPCVWCSVYFSPCSFFLWNRRFSFWYSQIHFSFLFEEISSILKVGNILLLQLCGQYSLIFVAGLAKICSALWSISIFSVCWRWEACIYAEFLCLLPLLFFVYWKWPYCILNSFAWECFSALHSVPSMPDLLFYPGLVIMFTS